MRGFGKRVTLDAAATCKKSHKIDKRPDGVRITMLWKGIDVEDEKAVVDIAATADVPNGSDLVFWNLEINNIPFRVAIPNKLINPMVEAMETMPDVKYTIKIPPISANGRFNSTIVANLISLNSK